MKKEETTKQHIILTLEQKRAFAKEIREVGSTNFLINRKIVRLGENGNIIVFQYEGLTGTKVEGMDGYEYRNDIPMNFWSEVVHQVNNYIRSQEKAKNKGIEQLANMEGF